MGRNAQRFLGFIDGANRPARSGNQQRLATFYGDAAARPSWLLRPG